MAIQVYINFEGNCREAVEFYAEVFGADPPEIMTFGEAPLGPEYPVADEDKDLIMHTWLNIHDGLIMFSDVTKDMGRVMGNNVIITVVTDDIDALTSEFNALSEDAHVEMELQETFWSKCYGYLVDKFGIPWQFVLDTGEMDM